jgi:hypothetical protein
MGGHPTVRQSFFIRFLLITAFIGNGYLCLQAMMHSFNLHNMDLFVRWYAFKANHWCNIPLLVGTLVTLAGLRKIYRQGIAGFRWYGLGKLITTLAYGLLILLEYKISNLPLPYVLFPFLLLMESLYPILLYISLRKSKRRITY